MMFTLQKRLVSLLIVGLLLLGGCVKSTSENSFCLLYSPIYTDREDTEVTRIQVDKANATFDCICERDLETCPAAGF